VPVVVLELIGPILDRLAPLPARAVFDGFYGRPQIGWVEKGTTADLDSHKLAPRSHVPQLPLTDAETPARLFVAQQEPGARRSLGGSACWARLRAG